MKLSFLLATLWCCSLGGVDAQFTLDWMNPAGEFNKIAVMSATDHLDNLVVTGYLQSNNIFTREYDINGNFLWEAIDSSGLPGLYEKPIWTTCDNDNNVYVVGKRYSISSWEYPDAVVALKYNSSGTLIWKQTVSVSVLIGSSFPGFNMRCETDAIGNLYIGTAAASPSGFILIKMDPDGNILFVNNNTTNAPTGFASMRLAGDRIIMTGPAGSNSSAPVIVWDTGGNVVWTALGTGNSGVDVETDDTGNVYLLTSYPNQVSATSGQDIVIYKYDPNGVQLWKKDFHFGGTEFATRFSLVGDKISAIGYSTTTGYFDWVIFQLDFDGNLLWNSTYNGTSFNDEYPRYLAAKPNGDVVVTGVGGPSPDPFNLSYIQMVIVEYDSSGNQVWLDTPNIYGGSGLVCSFASDNSLYAISYYNMTAYHYNGTSQEIVGCTNCLAMNYNPDAQTDDGSCVISCSGDLDYNGAINSSDLLIFVAQFGLTGDCITSDLNQDGTVNVTDLLLFVVLFGASC